MKLNWKNIGISCAITLVWVAVVALVSESGKTEGITPILNVLTAIALTICSVKAKSSRYKNVASAPAVFIAVLLTGPLGMIFVIYGLLQIKQGLAELKEIKKA